MGFFNIMPTKDKEQKIENKNRAYHFKHEYELDRIVADIRSKRDSLLKRKESLKQREKYLTERNGGTNVRQSDKVKLNIGGEVLHVRRDVLTQIKTSRLEALFSGRWENRLLRDNNDRIFLDLNPYCFKKIVDFLSLLKISSVKDVPPIPIVDLHQEDTFKILLSFFGIDKQKMEEIAEQRSVDTVHVESQKVKERKDSGISVYDELNDCIIQEKIEIRKADEELSIFENNLAKEESFIAFFTKNNDDELVMEIDVNGKIMSTKKSTLCQFEDSILAKEVISVETENKHQKEKKLNGHEDYDRILLPYPSNLIEIIIDILRLRKILDKEELVNFLSKRNMQKSEWENFQRVVKYLFPNEKFWLNLLFYCPEKVD